MSDLFQHIKKVAELTLGSQSPETEGNGHLSIKHVHYPLLIVVHARGPLNEQGKIEVSASAPFRPTAAGYRYSIRDFCKDRRTPCRTFRADRFQTEPERIAREIQSQIIEPSVSAAIEVLKRTAEAHHIENNQMQLVDDLARICHDLTRPRRHQGPSSYIRVGNMAGGSYGSFEIRKNGYNELHLRSMTPEHTRQIAKALYKILGGSSHDRQ